jgi:formyltetrahydrofolate synthetase
MKPESQSTFSFIFLSTDTGAELAAVRKEALAAGAVDAVVSKHWSLGGEGAVELAKAVETACTLPTNFKQVHLLLHN